MQDDAEKKAEEICGELAPMAALEYTESLERFVCESASTSSWLGAHLKTAVLEQLHAKIRVVNVERDMRELRLIKSRHIDANRRAMRPSSRSPDQFVSGE